MWRTINGRHIFIEKGQSLTDAMKKSGKFSDKEIKSNNSSSGGSSSNSSEKKEIKKENKSKKTDEINNKSKTSEVDNKETSNKNKMSDNERTKKLEELKKEEDEAQGFLAKAKAREKREAFEKGYDDVEEYRKAKDIEHQNKVAKSLEEREKREIERKAEQEAANKSKYENWDKYKDDKINSKTSEEKVSSLKEERSKYNSDEEFENSFTKLYHGGSKESVEEVGKNVEIMSVNEKVSKYGDMSGGNIYGLSTATKEKSAKVFTLPKGEHIDDMTYKEIKSIINQGYDAINVGGDENEMRILNPNKVYTKSQLKKALK